MKPNHPARPVSSQVSEETLRRILERYRQHALELGSAAAEVIPASYVSVDERVRLKCFVPRCFRMGESPNCPPYTPALDEVRRAFSRYSWAVLIKVELKHLSDYVPKPGQSAAERRKALSFHGKTSEVVSGVEGQAFRDGYHLALGFGGGSCKDYLCQGQVCQFLDSGRCRFPLRARPAMEAMGIDVFGLVSKVGWQVYPVTYADQDPDSIPCGISVGIVFIH
jgi:predicted metal-binding protein